MFRTRCSNYYQLGGEFISRAKFTTNNKQKWEGIVGLEVHAQINTKSKLFSGSPNTFGGSVNSNVSLFDAAIPGTLPVLNKQCVESGIMTALALNCKVNSISLFDRKHYFYADLPAGYQITQQRMPLAMSGFLKFQVFSSGSHKALYDKTSKIKQLQLEQDSGKSLHDEELNRSLIDLNRAGIPLMEIVFEPDLCNGEEAASLLKELTLILSRMNTCSCKMEEGGLRVDANISVRKRGTTEFGVRTEVKNIGSIRGVAKAVNFEIERHIRLVESGKEVVNETRAWDGEEMVTVPMRDKEIKQDYRFMPEPNLPPLRINISGHIKQGEINVPEIRSKIPELPQQSREKLIKNYSLSSEFAFQLVNDEVLHNYFYYIMAKPSRKGKLVVNILLNELLTLENKGIPNFNLKKLNINAVGEVIDLIQGGEINLVTARKVLEEVVNGESNPKKLVEVREWSQISDMNQLRILCEKAILNNPKVVSQYKNGKLKVFPALLGYIAKISNKRANMDTVTKILKDMLKT